MISFLPFVLLCAALFGREDRFSDVNRIVAIGDVHGDFDRFVALLKTAGLIDDKKRWSGGKTHLVQTGDIVDRGDHSRAIMDLLMSLEKQAPKAGGRVHVLLGNHEAMNLYGDLRYVSEGEYAAFAGPRSAELREAFYEAYVKQSAAPKGQEEPEQTREKWFRDHPLGWVEHRQNFGRNGKYGKWLRQKDAVVRINRILFLHGGLGPKYASWSLQDINKRVREELTDFSKLENGIVMDEEGPFWFRGLAQAPEDELSGLLEDLLKRHDVDHLVVAHTPTRAAVLPRFGGKVILIDVGLSESYGGPLACLIIENGRFQVLHEGKRLDLPMDRPAILEYLRAAAAVKSSPVLDALIANDGEIEFAGE
ncbi:MAG TPA: metallophosphoesterase [Acidobacteriota bacterium]|nr:metallophosphoesterase [Acidobacteriota bacterium]